MIIPGADPLDLPKAVGLAEKYDNIYFAVGIHPYDAQNFDESILEYVAHQKCVAIGECGLDYYRLPEDETEKLVNKELQKRIFIRHIQIAKQYKKPLIVHIRDATHDSKTILIEQNASEVGGVLHCFNASFELLSLANDGFYFGIGGVVTFSNAKKLIEILPQIPLEKLLIETDAPYLTPHPFRGELNKPEYTKYVAQKIATLLHTTQENIEHITTNNALNLFGIEIK